MMKLFEKNTSRRTLLVMVLSSAVATAFPLSLKQDRTSQETNVEAAKRFVGAWRGKSDLKSSDLNRSHQFQIETGEVDCDRNTTR